MIEIISDTPTAPAWFLKQLRVFDPHLYLTWHRQSGSWMLRYCNHVHEGDHAACEPIPERTCYVTLIRDKDGKAMPLNERVFEKLARMDTWRAGYGPDRLKSFLDDCHRLDTEEREKTNREIREIATLNSRDHRVQLNELRTLVQRHDMRPNEIDRMKRFDKSQPKPRATPRVWSE